MSRPVVVIGPGGAYRRVWPRRRPGPRVPLWRVAVCVLVGLVLVGLAVL